MEYVPVQTRFLFFNGVNRFTVHFSWGLAKWFVFKDEEENGALYSKQRGVKAKSTVNVYEAEDILNEYLQQ